MFTEPFLHSRQDTMCESSFNPQNSPLGELLLLDSLHRWGN